MNFTFTLPTSEPSTSENELLDLLQAKLDKIDNENAPKRIKEDKWEPKEWRAEYEAVVFMHFNKMSGIEIAAKTGFSPQHVYNILGTERAIEIEKMLIQNIRGESINVLDEMQQIQRLTVKRLRKSLEDDNRFNESPLGYIRTGLDVMKGMGEFLKTQPTTEIKNNIVIPPSVADRFLAGLEKSDQARALLSSGSNETIEEAEFTVVEK